MSSYEITELLHRLGDGDQGALDRLMALVYQDLRDLAHRYMNAEKPDHLLDATALVHELYLKLSGQAELDLKHRGHFFGAAARAMRQILVDHARALGRKKRGGEWRRQDVEALAPAERPLDLLILDEAITRLAAESERKARVVELRYFAGLTVDETAQALQTTTRTVERDWKYAQVWLHRELSGDRGRTSHDR